MEILVANRVVVLGLDGAGEKARNLQEMLLARFTYENPVYWEARRNRRPCRHIPRRIVLCEASGDGLVTCPRGALDEVLRIVGLDADRVRDRTAFPTRAQWAFRGTVRPYQEQAIQAVLASRQGVVQAPTGSGKTVIAMALIARLPTPALIVVHTSVLFEQTAEQVRRFLGVEPGMVGQGREEVSDVTIAMVQTLMRRDLEPWRDRFGLVILDEAHHCPAETFKTVIQEFSARYRIGLSATPTRKDRLHPILFDVMGPIRFVVTPRTLLRSGSIARARVIRVETGFRARYVRNDYADLIGRLVRNGPRNAVVIEAILKHRGRRSLVLTERVDHAHLLAKILRDRGLEAVALTGEVPREQRDSMLQQFARGEVSVLVSTTALVGEGFDLPALDVVFLTVPHANPAKTTQILGRALRPYEGKSAGVIVDFVDSNVPLLKSQADRRMRVYRRFEADGPSGVS